MSLFVCLCVKAFYLIVCLYVCWLVCLFVCVFVWGMTHGTLCLCVCFLMLLGTTCTLYTVQFVQFGVGHGPTEPGWAAASFLLVCLINSLFVCAFVYLLKEVLIGPPWGGGNKNLLAPPGGANKNLLAPPPNNVLDDAVLFHCSTAAGSCYPLQMHGK